MRRVGIIGAGTVGRGVAARLAAGAVPGLEVSGFLLRRPAARDLESPWTVDVDAFLETAPRVVVEAAGHDAVRDHAERCLLRGADVLCLSLGALADDALRRRLAAAGANGARLRIPSGAIAGLDALAAAAEGEIESVVVEQRKPPATLLGEGHADLEESHVVFEGSAREVVARYPRTTNVVAAVALAGIGFDKTSARVVADPELRANVARLDATGSFGTLAVELRNVPSDNPRTSAIVADSVIASLRRLDAAVIVPA